jgi:hypothetical protein
MPIARRIIIPALPEKDKKLLYSDSANVLYNELRIQAVKQERE